MLLRDCIKLNKVKKVNPNRIVAESFLIQAEKTLSKIEAAIKEKDYLWASVKIYYAAYYSLSAFLWFCGVKSDNHDCSIQIASHILDDKELLKNIMKLKDSRIDNQYYLRISEEKTLHDNYRISKQIYIMFYNICINNQLINVKEINELFKERK